ncbi:hypothetical protein Tco_0809458 [Tanacetum coccineum]
MESLDTDLNLSFTDRLLLQRGFKLLPHCALPFFASIIYIGSPGCLGKALDGLKTIEIVSVEGSRPELLFIKILLDHSLSLEKMIIRPRTTDDPHKMLKITRNVMQFPRASTKAKMLCLDPKPPNDIFK